MHVRRSFPGLRFNKKTKRSNTVLNLGCGFTRVARGVDHERGVVILKTGCVIDGIRKICMSQRKIMKTVIALGKKKQAFDHENVAYQKKNAPT